MSNVGNVYAALDSATGGVRAEESVLANLLDFDGKFDVISDLLTADNFGSEINQLIYKTVSELATAGQPYDSISVLEILSARGHSVDDHIAKLMVLPLVPEQVLRNHAEIIKDKAVRRRSISVLRRGIQALESQDVLTADVNNDVMGKLTSIDTGQSERKTVFSMEDMANAQVAAMQAIGDGEAPYVETGFPEIDQYMKAGAGMLIVVAARPSMGKSLLTANFQTHISRTRDGLSPFFSCEMPAEDVFDRMAAAETGIKINDIVNRTLSEDEWAKLMQFYSTIKSYNFKVIHEPAITISQMRTHLNKLRREEIKAGKSGKFASIGVDYLQIMGGIGAENRVNNIGIVTAGLKQLAIEFECPVFLLSQLNRDVEKRPNKRPLNSDLRDSGTIEQDADVIMFIYRDDMYKQNTSDKSVEFDNVAEIIFGKVRKGKRGTVRLGFDGEHGRFNNFIPYHDLDDDIPTYGQ